MIGAYASGTAKYILLSNLLAKPSLHALAGRKKEKEESRLSLAKDKDNGAREGKTERRAESQEKKTEPE